MAKVESFLPEDYVERRMQRRTNVICLALFVVVIGGVLAAFAVADREHARERKRDRELREKFAEAARRLDQLEQLEARKQEMIRKARVTGTLIERVPRSIVLAELINNMPDTLSLLELQLETKIVQERSAPRTALEKVKADAKAKAAATEVVERRQDVSLRLVGVAPTDVQVAQFMTALGQAELFRDVNLSFSEEASIDKERMRKFRVDMKLNTDVDLHEFEPTLVKRELKMNPMGERLQIAPGASIGLVRD